MFNASVIGLGQRGMWLAKYLLLKMDNVKIVSVCDVYEDRVAEAVNYIRDAGGDAKGFTDFKDALNVKGVDMAFVFTDWATHTPISIYAMEKGIPVASEVGSEYSLENCFELVRTQERTSTPYMLVENCCWDRAETLVTAMARKGVLGTIVHCQGAYSHDLRNEVAYGHVTRHYRFDNYLKRCCDNYPTHDFGPIAKLLDINRGNRILTVSSFASRADGLKEYIASRPDATEEMKNAVFAQGDVVTTVITCANGETVVLRLDTTLPRIYSRDLIVRGTKGMYTMDTNSVFLDGEQENWNLHLNNAKEYEAEYLPDFWKNITPEAMAAGHGGMDWFAYSAFVDAVKTGAPMPVDVYDSASWQAIGVLSEISISQNGAPQAMPDFTKGAWIKRPRLDVFEI